MIKQDWNISGEEKSRILNLHESATKNLYINEQGRVSETTGTTDKNTVSHARLTAKFGLPDGAKYENFYYIANISDVIAMSQSKENIPKYLSIFKPQAAYNEDKTKYLDYINVNKDVLQGTGSKVFKFTSGTVIAAHNGLLALARAMDMMNGGGGPLTIIFGGVPTVKTSRSSIGKNFNANRVFNLNSTMVGIADNITALAITPAILPQTGNVYNDSDRQGLLRGLRESVGIIAAGIGIFINGNEFAQVVKDLTPKGFSTKLNFDFNGLTKELDEIGVGLSQSLPDQKGMGQNEFKQRYGFKLDKLAKIDAKYRGPLLSAFKENYTNNLILFINEYLPESKNDLLARLPEIQKSVMPNFKDNFIRNIYTSPGKRGPLIPPTKSSSSQTYAPGS
jgi:hypothetical protein